MPAAHKSSESPAARPGEETPRDALTRGAVVIFDGAMGTELYAKGVFIHRSFEALNLNQPALVREVHASYVAAGAHVLETNTFAANRFRLAPYAGEGEGHGDVEAINVRGVELARDAAGERAWVAGAVGPLGVRIEPFGAIAREEARDVFAEQARFLHGAGVDLFVLETFAHLPELEEAIRAVRSVSDRPIIAEVQVRAGARTREGVAAAEAASRMERAGADAVGVNCSEALATLDALEQMRHATTRPLVGQPNAGSPRTVTGRSIYLASPEYLLAWGRRALRVGVHILGGCCGTMPDHIRALHSLVHEDRPEVPSTRLAVPADRPLAEPTPKRDKSALAKALADKEFVAGVEMLPPRGWAADQVLAAARTLAEAPGPRFLSLPEGPADSARLPPSVLARRCTEAGVECVVHYSCRGRRLVRMQSDLLGAYASGVRNLVLLTGDPLSPGAEPRMQDDLEIDSIGAVNLATRLNRGEDVGGNPIGMPTGLHVGVRLDPTAYDLDREVSRFAWKVDAGAEFALTVPVFDPEALYAVLDRIADNRIPVIATLWPLRSSREAEFFEHEQANVPVPPTLVERIREAEQQGRAEQEGLAIARELLATLRPMVEGILVVAPEGRSELALSVLDSVR